METKKTADLRSRELPTVQRLAFGDHANLRTHATGDADLYLLNVANSAQSAYASIAQVYARRMADESITPFARLAQSADQAQRQIGRVAAEFNAAIERGNKRLAELSTALEVALKPQLNPGTAHVDSEIRAHVRDLLRNGDAPKVAALLIGESPDRDVVRALATAPAFLSGLGDELHARARAQHLRWQAPDEFAEHQSTVAAGEAARTALDTLREWTHELVDIRAVEAHRKAQAAEQSAA